MNYNNFEYNSFKYYFNEDFENQLLQLCIQTLSRYVNDYKNICKAKLCV